MLENKEGLLEDLNRFNEIYDMNLTYEALEEKAQAYNSEHPGRGFKLAYQDLFASVYSHAIERIVKEGKFVSSVNTIGMDFDVLVIQPYIKACEESGIEINLKADSYGIANVDTIATIKRVLDTTPTTKAGFAMKELEKGSLTVDSALEFSRSKDNDNIEKNDALTIATYAQAIATRNKNRSFLEVLRHPIDHIREKFAVRAMRKVAAKYGSIEQLTAEATYEDSNIDMDRTKLSQFERVANQRYEREKMILDLEANIDNSDLSERVDTTLTANKNVNKERL